MIALETFNKSQLEELINSDRYKAFPYLPITAHRALSHIHNPKIDEQSILLIIAFEGEKLAGYIGILGDQMKHKQQTIPMGWMSTLFVHPDFRGKKIAQKLLNKACDAYHGRILMTEFTPEAENMYRKSELFLYQKELEGISFHFLSNLKTILPSKNQKWKKFAFIFHIVDEFINIGIQWVRLFQTRTLTGVEFSTTMDTESANFIKENKIDSCFNKSIDEISWMIKYPWILKGSNTKKAYRFSDYEKKFEYLFIKIFKDTKLHTLLILSVRQTNAKLLYQIGDIQPLQTSEALFQFIIKHKITNLISFEKDLNLYFLKKNLVYHKIRNRKFLIHKEFAKLLGSDFILNISAGDSDAVFT